MSIYDDSLTHRTIKIVILTLSLQSYRHTQADGFPQYPMTCYSGGRLGTDSYAGSLIMTSESFEGLHDETKRCTITIAPRRTDSNNSLVLFYFTEFNLSGKCEENNLTIYDGRYFNVKGLGGTLCGRNKSLETRTNVFTSTASEIKLLYQWRDRWSYRRSSFNLTFVSFHNGPCPDDMFTCSTGRCIPTSVSCHEELNACGNGTERRCDIKKAIENILQSALRIAQNLFYIVAICIVVMLLKKIYMRNVHKKYGSVCDIPIFRRVFGVSNRHATRQAARRSSLTQQRTDVPEAERVPLSVYNNNTAQTILEPPPYDTLVMNEPNNFPNGHNNQITSPAVPANDLPPPPSYEEVVADSDNKFMRT